MGSVDDADPSKTSELVTSAMTDGMTVVVNVEPSVALSSQEVLSAWTMLARIRARLGLLAEPARCRHRLRQRPDAALAYGPEHRAEHSGVTQNKRDYGSRRARNLAVRGRQRLYQSQAASDRRDHPPQVRRLQYRGLKSDCARCALKQTGIGTHRFATSRATTFTKRLASRASPRRLLSRDAIGTRSR